MYDTNLITITKDLVKDERLTSSERFLYLVLATLSDGETVEIDWNHVSIITGRSIKTIKKYLRHLIVCGWCVKDNGGYILKSDNERRS